MIYSDRVLMHCLWPQNAYSMLDADAVGSYIEPSCEDALTFYIKIKDNCIQDISYLASGSCVSIATCSITSELAKGKCLDDALKITTEDIIEGLGGLPENKVHCSNLAVSALRNAINNYQRLTGTEDYYENSNTCR
ncbi:NifU-like protein [Sporotomaculum syntrophicum]|uniref:NifU-like protein n=1 Tax=Sporotomaculum syntrophicum TaxID=182264 RepID=A0A9D3AWM1_9FIRM|nr:iron-sulfur cluster assembly scaffold protein [Sporotomaculum syntrophicum]KAF1083982.1 NifU-like protein [Sporotomaculum syntrophicum]